MKVVGSWAMSFYLKTNWWWGRHSNLLWHSTSRHVGLC